MARQKAESDCEALRLELNAKNAEVQAIISELKQELIDRNSQIQTL
jgi:hypothetical protein